MVLKAEEEWAVSRALSHRPDRAKSKRRCGELKGLTGQRGSG